VTVATFNRTLDVRSSEWYDGSYHGELIGMTGAYATGTTNTIILTGECKSHRVLCHGANDIVYLNTDVTLAATGLTQTNIRHKLIATTTGTETIINMRATTLDFVASNSASTLNIYVDSYY